MREVKKMLNLLKGFFKEEEGMGTVEIVVIIAVLVSIALIFRKAITEWVRNTIQQIFNDTDTSIQKQ